MPTYFPLYQVAESSDDEIEVIPYVKPPPPLIELLNSSSSDEEEAPSAPDDQKKQKKKKKREGEEAKDAPASSGPETISKTNTDCDDNTALSSSGSTPHESKNDGKNSEGGSGKGAVPTSGTESEQVGNNDAEPGGSGITPGSPGSDNAAVPVSLSGSDGDNNVSPEEPLPILRISNAIFEADESSLEQPVELESVNPVNSDPSPAGSRSIAAGTGKAKKIAQSKSPANANKAKAGAPRQRGANKHSIASQRTNEEIVNFLKTLGIPLEPQDLQPNKRVRKPRKPAANQSFSHQPVLDVQDAVGANGLLTVDNGVLPLVLGAKLPISAATVEESTSGSVIVEKPEAFVSVTDESSKIVPSTPRRSPKKARIGRLKARTPNGINKLSDLEDTAFTAEELRSVTLNMTSNVVFSSGVELVRQMSPVSHDQDEDEARSRNKTGPVQSESSGSIAMEVDTPNTQSSGPNQVDSDEHETEALNKSLNQFLNEKNEFHQNPPSLPVIPPPDCPPGVPGQDTSHALEKSFQMPPYLPPHFSQEMVQFYDTTMSENLHLSHLLEFIPDDPKLWRTRRLPPKPKIRRGMRCLNCHQIGHFAKHCTEKKRQISCRVCGSYRHVYRDKGGRSTCPNSSCLNCGREQDTFTSHCYRCTNSRRPLECRLCNVTGHEEFTCPDHWRRFHSTTALISHPDEAMKRWNPRKEIYGGVGDGYRSNRELYCSNCATKGHNYFNCKVTYRSDQYVSFHRQKPFVLNELRAPETAAAPITVPETALPVPERTVSLQSQNTDNTNGHVELIQVQISNQPNPSRPNPDAGSVWRCLSYPDCQNAPSLGNKCHTMFVTKSDHRLLLNAQAEGVIDTVRKKHRTQISVLTQRAIIHVWGDSHVSTKEDLAELAKQLERENNNGTSSHTKRKSSPIDEDLTSPRKNETSKQNEEAKEAEIAVESAQKMENSKKALQESAEKEEGNESQQMQTDEGSNMQNGIADADGRSGANKPAEGTTGGESIKVAELSTSTVETRDRTEHKTISTSTGTAEGEKVVTVPKSTNQAEESKNVSSSPQSSDKNKIKPSISQASSSNTANPPSPEVITLEDDDDEGVNNQIPLAVRPLTVTLLHSEWVRLFKESTKKGGLVSQLSAQFGVHIFICKDSLSVSIHSGTEENRKLVQKNIIFWLECAASHIEYYILRGENEYSEHVKKMELERNGLNPDQKPNPTKRPREESPPAPNRDDSQGKRFRSPKRSRFRDQSRGRGRNNSRDQSGNNREHYQNSNHPQRPTRYFNQPPPPQPHRNYNQQPPSSQGNRDYNQNQQIPPPEMHFDFSRSNYPNPLYQAGNNWNNNNFNNNRRGGRGGEAGFYGNGNNNQRGRWGGNRNRDGKNNILNFYNESDL